MPHSISSSDSPARAHDDEVLPDAPPQDAGKDETGETAPGNEADKTTGVRLEDMFDDDDEDDEFPSSIPDNNNNKVESSPASEMEE